MSKMQQEGNVKWMHYLFMMEEVHEGFCEELMKLAVQYRYSIKKATYRTKDISFGELKVISSKRQVFLNNLKVTMTSK